MPASQSRTLMRAHMHALWLILGISCRNLQRNLKTLITATLFENAVNVNSDRTKIRTDWRRAMNGSQFQMRLELCSYLRPEGESPSQPHTMPCCKFNYNIKIIRNFYFFYHLHIHVVYVWTFKCCLISDIYISCNHDFYSSYIVICLCVVIIKKGERMLES